LTSSLLLTPHSPPPNPGAAQRVGGVTRADPAGAAAASCCPTSARQEPDLPRRWSGHGGHWGSRGDNCLARIVVGGQRIARIRHAGGRISHPGAAQVPRGRGAVRAGPAKPGFPRERLPWQGVPYRSGVAGCGGRDWAWGGRGEWGGDCADGADASRALRGDTQCIPHTLGWRRRGVPVRRPRVREADGVGAAQACSARAHGASRLQTYRRRACVTRHPPGDARTHIRLLYPHSCNFYLMCPLCKIMKI
ncbi:hypothetical protein B484DRAFT_158425, partial [Ochromonadaceae sp. CCMP2298]